MMDATNKYSKLSHKVSPTLFLEFHGSDSSIKGQVELVGRYLTNSYPRPGMGSALVLVGCNKCSD